MTKPTYYFLKSFDGRYLQTQYDSATGHNDYWLEKHLLRAWTPCCDTLQTAEQFRAAAKAAGIENLQIVAEAL